MHILPRAFTATKRGGSKPESVTSLWQGAVPRCRLDLASPQRRWPTHLSWVAHLAGLRSVFGGKAFVRGLNYLLERSTTFFFVTDFLAWCASGFLAEAVTAPPPKADPPLGSTTAALCST